MMGSYRSSYRCCPLLFRYFCLKNHYFALHFHLLACILLCMTRKEIKNCCSAGANGTLSKIAEHKQLIHHLFKAHYAQMYRLAVSILYDEDESKDVVSEVFARLIGSDTVLRPDTIEVYLLASVRNQCRNVLERRQVRERFLRLMSAETVQQTNSEEETLRMEELIQYINEQLPPLTLQIFKLRFLSEKPRDDGRNLGMMTCQEIANTLGISRQTVHSHLQQSVERIKDFFKQTHREL